jgi:SAM-dependent methyltransferase
VVAGRDLDTVVPSELYDAGYFSEGEYADYVGDRRVIERNFRPRLAELVRLRPGGDLLEIGCAYGFFLDLARRHYTVTGFDIAADAVAYARDRLGLDARAGDFLAAAVEPASADVVAMWDIIEHLVHPDRYVERVHAVLRPGGIFALSTGDIGSVVARWRGERWRLIHPPTHLHYFTRKSLVTLLGRMGFTVLGVRYPAIYRSLRQVARGILVSGRARGPRLYAAIAGWRALDWAVPLNTWDIMTVLARRA